MRDNNLKVTLFLLITVFLSSCLSGCSILGFYQTPILAVPEQVSYEDEIKLAQISQQLYRQDLDDEDKLQLFFERGILYHALGFKAFAQSDFSQLLHYNIAIPDVYNYFGIYAMDEEDYNSAFMAFNTALELDSDYEFAYINRAIALYRSERYESALEDAIAFYDYAPNDPIRMLWVYLLASQLDQQKAKTVLLEQYDQMEDKAVWGSDIIAFYLGRMTEQQLMKNLQQDVKTNRELAQRLCETYFYLGKYYQSKGDNKRAEVLFKYALANNVYDYLEHQQALFEIKQLNKK